MSSAVDKEIQALQALAKEKSAAILSRRSRASSGINSSDLANGNETHLYTKTEYTKALTVTSKDSERTDLNAGFDVPTAIDDREHLGEFVGSSKSVKFEPPITRASSSFSTAVQNSARTSEPISRSLIVQQQSEDSFENNRRKPSVLRPPGLEEVHSKPSNKFKAP